MKKSSLLTVLLVLFLDLVGFSIVFPMFARILEFYSQEPEGLLSQLNGLLERVFDISNPHRHAAFFGGVLAGIYSLIQFVVTPWWGRLSDRVGRKPVLMATVSLNALSYFVWVFAGSFTLFVIARIVSAFASGNISVASAAVADLSDRESRTKAMGLMGMAIGLGFIIGPALGGTFALMDDSGGTPGGFAINPFSIPAGIALALSLFNVWQVYARLEETLPPSKRGQQSNQRSANPLRFFRRDLGKGMPKLNGAYLLFMIGFAGFEGTLVFLLAEKLGWGPGKIAGCMVWLGFISAMVQGGIVRRMVGKTGPRKLAMLGLVLLVPGYISIALVGENASAALLIVGVSILSIGVGFLSPCLSAMVSLRASADAQGAAMGSFRSVGALGRAIGPVVAAILYFRFGPGAPYLAAGILALIPAFLVVGLRDDQ